MYDFDETIRSRRSVRGFLTERSVDPAIIRASLELAQRAPSNCNVQPWRVYLVSGARCEALRHALVVAATGGQPPAPDDPIDNFTDEYRKLQVDCAVALYREMGIERGDQLGRMHAYVRNFELFNAPHVAIVCMQKDFGLGVALDVGMWVQTFMLALWSRGIGSCAQASLRLYPHIIRHELKIPEELRILCGVSFGHEDESVPANRTRQLRDPIEANVTFLDA